MNLIQETIQEIKKYYFIKNLNWSDLAAVAGTYRDNTKYITKNLYIAVYSSVIHNNGNNPNVH